MPVLTLVLADRMHPLFGKYALWPLTTYAAATVVFWGWSGDVLPYAVVRYGGVVLLAFLLLSRRPRYSESRWMIAAVALQVPVSLSRLPGL